MTMNDTTNSQIATTEQVIQFARFLDRREMARRAVLAKFEAEEQKTAEIRRAARVMAVVLR